MTAPFRCPVCHAPLLREENTLRCEKGHSFDRAAQGYTNLLLCSRMRTKVPGDSREMVMARRKFLDLGYYAPFREALCSILCRALRSAPAPVVIDAGCGEGYYTQAVYEALSSRKEDACVMGFDVSKCAVRAACSRGKQVAYAVASCFDLPVQDRAADALFAVFSPIAEREFARVVRPGGYLLLAVAGERHLFGMKELLYAHPYENEHRETNYPGFAFVSRTPVRTRAVLHGEEIEALFSMTPYYWKTPAEGASRLRQAGILETELGFDFLLYRRTAEEKE